MNQAKAIKKHAAQHDLFNRLHSIAADERFVRKVAHEWYADRFEVVANQRCGTWYCDPSTSSSAYAYFKSTDGHTLNWDFNLRRSNLSLAVHIERVGGIILVDSTRRGKRMPDGLSKTVPIWCSVVNRALQLRGKREGKVLDGDIWDVALYLPGQIVSPSERAQIEDRLDGWAEDLEASVLPLPLLRKPLRPFFVHPATTSPPHIPENPNYVPVICLSASRWVNDGDDGDAIPTATRVGEGMFSRTVAFDYVPGAGDDDELWARGLKPQPYHERKERILSTPRDELPSVVDDIVEEHGLIGGLEGISVADEQRSALPLLELRKSATPVSEGMVLDLGEPISKNPGPSVPREGLVVRIIELDKPRKDSRYVVPASTSGGPVVIVGIPSSRARAKDYLDALDDLVNHIETQWEDNSVLCISPGHINEYESALAQSRSDTPTPLALTRNTAQQYQAARKVILPIAVALLCTVPELGGETDMVDKSTAADTLHKMVALWPDGNPPRAALKRVNEFLMSSRP